MLLVVVIVLLGLPILSGGRGGLAVLTGPTGGFFIVWPFAAFLVGFLAEKFWKNINIGKYIVANIIGGIVFSISCWCNLSIIYNKNANR